MRETEKIAVAKPVATRPYASFRSFSELLAGAIDASPPASVAIKPVTVRLKPLRNDPSAELVSSMDVVSESPICHLYDNTGITTSRADSGSNIIYKPTAKAVSRSMVSLLANMGNDIHHQRAIEVQNQEVHVPDHDVQNQSSFYLYQNMPSNMATNQVYEPCMPGSSNLEGLDMEQENVREQQLAYSGERPSYDGYNWRKYGQKQVKGSEYPRSYYKCTHPNCPVKKMVERSLDGKITENVYKGEHSHPKPRPPKRITSGSEGQAFVSNEQGDPSCGDPLIDSRMDSHSDGVPYHQNSHDSLLGATYSSGLRTPETIAKYGETSMVGSKGICVDDDMRKNKRRKKLDIVSEASASTQDSGELHSAVQAPIESDVSGDGYRWRKYGQKVVKGNSYPRSYYRCTSLKCSVRKYVERASVDPGSFITTYEGKHNHDKPERKGDSTHKHERKLM